MGPLLQLFFKDMWGYRSSHLSRFELKRISQNEAQLVSWAGQLGSALQPGMVVALQGPLGAGKTTWVRAMLRRLGVSGPVKSPTYALLEPYDLGELYFYHFDFYRINSPLELEDAGFRDCFDGHAICVVEWPEKAAGWLPAVDLVVHIELNEDSRNISLRAESSRGEECLKCMGL
jgi:tRNA threonylcarbamoyladenosine biosynthesis protein TsaE